MALVGSYIDRDELATLSLAPASLLAGDWIDPSGDFVDAEKIARRVKWLAFVDATLISWTSRINTQLAKRYRVPFGPTVPAIVGKWLADIVTPEIWGKRGWDGEDAHADDVKALAQQAKDDIAKAADSETGRFELPLRDDQDGSAITKGGPFGYAEADPYTWTDVQAEQVRR